MASTSGRRKPSRSSSAIVADKERGRHDLGIDAGTLDAVAPAGARGLLASSPFTVGGHRWRVQYYPDGDAADCKGWVSVFLLLDEDVADPVTARFRLSLVSEARELCLCCIKFKEELLSNPEVQHNFGSRSSRGYSKFHQNQVLASLVRRRGADQFSIRCDVVVLNGFRTEEEAPSAAAAIPASDLHRHLGDLLQSGRGTDVVFEVGGEAFAAHRCVLAARSPVISADLLDAAAAADGGAVHVNGVEPRAFRALLRYAYTNSLPEMDKEEEDAILRNLLTTADRYGLQRLKLICEDRLCRLVSVGAVEITLALAEQYKCDRLKEACLQFLGAPANLRAVMGARGQ